MAGDARARIRLSPAELDAFLAGRHTMTIATISPDGSPHLTAVWYIMDDGCPVFWTYAKSQKARNLERDPRITCLVEDGMSHGELHGAQLTGRAVVSFADREVESTWYRLTEKYNGTVTSQDRARFEAQADKRCVVRVEVTRVATRDHRKLGMPSAQGAVGA